VKAFFYTSIRNSCLDHLKHNQVQQKYLKFKKAIPEENGSFLDEVIRLEAYGQVYHEINKLPGMERKVLLLSLDEKSNDEIAISLNISVNTVRTHKARAYRVLRKNLGDIFLFFLSLRKSNL
jgi:RNA polymerase sigma-70 factor (ECF subfamily)